MPVAPGGVADIFDQLESNKNALQIKHFSVSQTTLDEVRKKNETGHRQRERERERGRGGTSVRLCRGGWNGSEGQKKKGTGDERRRERVGGEAGTEES